MPFFITSIQNTEKRKDLKNGKITLEVFSFSISQAVGLLIFNFYNIYDFENPGMSTDIAL